MTAEAMPESVWIELKQPDEYEGIVSAVQGLDGVSHIRDSRDLLAPIYGSIKALRFGALATAVFLVLAALLLVGNTIRLAALARRREIGIMRLVAPPLYIALPFLLEALVTAAAGVVLAGGALWAFLHFGIAERAADKLKFMPWIGMPDYWHAMLWVAVLGPV
ncbi:MAG: FtsX-like permease family protein [Nocardioides sp.]